MSGFNGSGVFDFTYNWVNDSANGIPITASRMDTQFADAAGGFDNCMTRDAQGAATVLIPFALGLSTTIINAYTATAGVPIQGTSTNSSAASGYVGEYLASTIAAGSAVGITSGAATNVTSVLLTPGDWIVGGLISYTGNAATTLTATVSSINTNSATVGTAGTTNRFEAYHGGLTPFGAAAVDQNIGLTRISLAAGASVYLVARATFGVNTCSVYGQINAWRIR